MNLVFYSMFVAKGICLIRIIFISNLFSQITQIAYFFIREKTGIGFQEYVMEI